MDTLRSYIFRFFLPRQDNFTNSTSVIQYIHIRTFIYKYNIYVKNNSQSYTTEDKDTREIAS